VTVDRLNLTIGLVSITVGLLVFYQFVLSGLFSSKIWHPFIGGYSSLLLVAFGAERVYRALR
jgi:hypothetical protein